MTRINDQLRSGRGAGSSLIGAAAAVLLRDISVPVGPLGRARSDVTVGGGDCVVEVLDIVDDDMGAAVSAVGDDDALPELAQPMASVATSAADVSSAARMGVDCMRVLRG